MISEEEQQIQFNGSDINSTILDYGLVQFKRSKRNIIDEQMASNSVQKQPTSRGPLKRVKRLGSSLTLTTILLPFVFLFLLPTFTIDFETTIVDSLDENLSNSQRFTRNHVNHNILEEKHESTSNNLLVLTRNLLIELIKLPLYRIRLTSGSGFVSAREINSKHDLQEEETHMRMMAPEQRSMSHHANIRSPNFDYQAGGGLSGEPTDSLPPPSSSSSSVGVGSVEGGSGEMPQAIGSSALETRSDLPAVRALNVKCEKNHMTVNIVFDRPFYGMVFSKGHYNDQKCVHLPANSGQTSVNFDIHLGKCGMSSSEATGQNQALQVNQNSNQQQQPNGLFIENTIIIQYDPQVQEIYDQARKLRCTWYDYYEKSVTFRPYNVDMMDAITANFLGDNIQCWMQIQVGKGPWASEVAGIVKIGQTMTMVLAIKDDENRFDMLVRNCVANDGKHQPIQLVDEYGCVARPKIMGKFQKVRNFGPAATVVSYAHFQAFKFPDSMSVHFQCVIQVCRYECPVPQCGPSNNQPSDSGGEIAGTSSNGGPTDYAASGTEIVSSKEPLPGATSYFSASPNAANRSSLNFKLDESQGRVQVKLDTSMMTGGSRLQQQQQQQQQGPLPPHLLQAEASYGSARGIYPSSASPPYFRQQPGMSGGAQGRPTILASGGLGRQQNVAPSSGSHFSAPYPSSSLSPSSLYANRIGEQLLPDTTPAIGSAKSLAQATSDAIPLALIASPRALRTTVAANNRKEFPLNHRFKRSTVDKSNETEINLDRDQRSPADSTAIRTQKTIQVVSPDDVAFSLLSPAEQLFANDPLIIRESVNQKRLTLNQDVCFSTGKLALAVLMTLVSLAMSMVVVVYFVLRQKNELAKNEKISTCYFPESPVNNDGSSKVLSSDMTSLSDEQLAYATQRRQQVEIQQRNKYLTRLYSQFVPATYWQQAR